MEFLKNWSLFFMLQTSRQQSLGATDGRYVKVVPLIGVKVCRGVEVQLYSFLTSARDIHVGELLASRSGHFTHLPQDKRSQCAQNRGLSGLQYRSDPLKKWSVLPRPRFEPRFFGHPADSVLTVLKTRSRLEGKVDSISEPLFCTGFLFSLARESCL
jgi:hypothetical protein